MAHRPARVAVRTLGRLPYRVKRFLAGRPVVIDGQELDVDAQIGVKLLNRTAGETFEKLPVELGRDQIAGEAWVFGGVDIALLLGEGGFHVYPAATFLPESVGVA